MRVTLFSPRVLYVMAVLAAAAAQRPDADFLDGLGKLLQSASISLPVSIPSDFLPTAIPSANVFSNLPSNFPTILSPRSPQSSRRQPPTATSSSVTSSHPPNSFGPLPKFNLPPELITQVASIVSSHPTNTEKHQTLTLTLSSGGANVPTTSNSIASVTSSFTRPSPTSLNDQPNLDDGNLGPPSNNQNLKNVHPLSQGQLRAMVK
ncbi:hypothetical protein HK096_011357 [Nowakowskiella sp. JEL0078]|nr:hypothetical protein HK096_011357 [Nowakowskiella sp. JEL0078]